VRDELLGLHPQDYDIATSATPQQVQRLFPGTHAVGASFGVVLVPINLRDPAPRAADVPAPAKRTVEVATFRTDGTYTDQRRPDTVTFSTPEDDAQRRDFTINALFLDPLTPGPDPLIDGKIIDFVNGQQDLAARVLRAVGDPDARLNEDHLRALRAVRLAARMDLAIDPATASAIARHARDLGGVSRERIGEELRKMLLHPTRAHAARTIQRLGLDKAVFDLGPRHATASASASPHAAMLPALAGLPARLWPGADVDAPLLAWLIDRGVPAADLPPALPALKRALCLTNAQVDALRHSAELLSTLMASPDLWPRQPVAQRKRWCVHPGLLAALMTLRTTNPPLATTIEADLAALAADGIGLAPPPMITGDDLIAAGCRPGRAFKIALEMAYNTQISQPGQERAKLLKLAMNAARS
jgi:poly(A) polymerase